MHSNMSGIMVWVWTLWSSDACEHRTLLWLGHGCSGHVMQSNMKVIMVWAWMLWSPDAVEHERYDGLGVDAKVIGCRRT